MAPRAGVYVATLTFFDENENLDLATLESHVSRLAESGISGIVTLGSNGEATHLTSEERKTVTLTVRQKLDKEGFHAVPVIVGASAQSTRECIKLCREAAEAGGSYALVLPPCYYKGAMSSDIIRKFYLDVADESPLPLIVYSFPAVVSDINMTSDLIIQISRHPNVVGTKFTCGDTGKLSRVAKIFNTSTPGREGDYWAVGGLADFELQALISGASGVIAGGANIVPKVCVKVFELFKAGKFQEAMKIQAILAEGDWSHTAAGIGGTKSVLQRHFGYGGLPRRPLTIPSIEAMNSLLHDMRKLIDLEKSLSLN